MERRAKAHILVAFLGYALWVTLKHLLAPGADRSQPSAAGSRHTALVADQGTPLLSTLQSADIILPTTDGREIRLRRITEPTPNRRCCSISSAFAYPSVSVLIRNVVQTQR